MFIVQRDTCINGCVQVDVFVQHLGIQLIVLGINKDNNVLAQQNIDHLSLYGNVYNYISYRTSSIYWIIMYLLLYLQCMVINGGISWNSI